jgi:hypothetical protein
MSASCTSLSEDGISDKNLGSTSSKESLDLHAISESTAKEIAKSVIHRTRSSEDAEVSYVMAKSAALDKDIVAYIINYPEEGGFCIIANDDRINPVLAYSESDTFSSDNELCMNYFVNNIESYMAEACNSENMVLSTSENSTADSVYCVEPIIKTKLGQWSPYNQIVEKTHPGCPVGCVPLTTVMLLSYTKTTLVYNNYKYYFPDINEAIVEGPSYSGIITTPITSSGFNPGPLQFEKTYNGAVRAISQLASDLGEAMNTDYEVDSSNTYISKARQVMSDIGCDVTSWGTYNDSELVSKLKDGYLIFQNGCKDGESVGHAWAIDGCKYKIVNNQYTDIYLNCDWGWDGDNNGYYCGSVFKLSSGYEYRLNSYFAVKIETTND